MTHVRAVAPDSRSRREADAGEGGARRAGQADAGAATKLAALGRAHLATDSLDAVDGTDAVHVASDGKAGLVYLRSLAKGQSLSRALQEALDEAIERLPIPKVMSYPAPAATTTTSQFVRPGAPAGGAARRDVVPVHALGLDAEQRDLGHRFLARARHRHRRGRRLRADARGRRQGAARFRAAPRRNRAIRCAAAAQGATVIMPDALLDEVTALVERPDVYAGAFEAEFLAVPQECLILTMQANQKYFALADASGKLRDRFLVVSNIDTADPRRIVDGNERVVRPRLADAKFFFDQDRKKTLAESRVRALAQRRLPQQARHPGRARRARCALAATIAPRIGADAALADRAALLAKADLLTDMVGEFPELQGIMGRYYARHDGEAPEVADAIAEHYWPRFAGDALPADAGRAGGGAGRQARDAGRHVRHRPAAHRRQGPVRACAATRSACCAC